MTGEGPARFETVDWADATPGVQVTRSAVAFAAALAVLSALFVYDYVFVGPQEYFVGSVIDLPGVHHAVFFEPTGMDWLVSLSALLFVFLVVLPLARSPATRRRYWRRLRRDRAATAAFAYLAVGTFLATVGVAAVGEPRVNLAHAYQPPLLTATRNAIPVTECAGPVWLDQCWGSLQYPLGTDRLGRNMVNRLLRAFRVTMLIAFVTSMLIVPLGTAVGTVAGYAGGLVDELLMRYVDVQRTLPAILVYLVLVLVFKSSLFLIVLVFGLLSWGGVAQVVRGEVLQRKSATYVAAARAEGATSRWVILRHVLPNTSGAVFTALSVTIPTLVLSEAALAYLQIGERYSYSFGQLIALGMREVSLHYYFPGAWWLSVEAAVFLGLTLLSFHVLGDAMRDVTDPRGGP